MSTEYPEQIYRHTTASAVRSWRERRGRYLLEGTRCNDCGDLHYPRRTVCSACNGRNLSAHKHPPTGTIEMANVCWTAAGVHLGYGENIPRVSTVIRLDDGVTVLAEVTDTPYDKIVPGARVEMVLKKLRRESNSTWMYGYKFVVCES
jgi:2-acetylphloroglucinol acetyltransferase